MNIKKVAEVFFNGNNKPYYFNSEILDLNKGEVVVVETAGGLVKANFKRYVSADRLKELEGIAPTRWILCRDRVLTGNIKDYCLKAKITKMLSNL